MTPTAPMTTGVEEAKVGVGRSHAERNIDAVSRQERDLSTACYPAMAGQQTGREGGARVPSCAQSQAGGNIPRLRDGRNADDDRPSLKLRPTSFADDDEVVWYHSNTLYSVYALTDGSENVVERYRYDAYGACTALDSDFSDDADNASDVENPYTFTARRLDAESGLMQYRNRYYGVHLGRFMSRDPEVYTVCFNLYSYLMGRTANRTDPLGLRVDWPTNPIPGIGSNPLPGWEAPLASPAPTFEAGAGDLDCCEGLSEAIDRANDATQNDEKCREWFEEHGSNMHGATFSVAVHGKWKIACLIGAPAWTVPGLQRIGVCEKTCEQFKWPGLASLLIHEAAHHYCPLTVGREKCAASAQEACRAALGSV